MLKLIARIIFFESNARIPKDRIGYGTQHVLRPAFKFGEDLLFSGIIKGDDNPSTFRYNQPYVVTVDFPTIKDEAYKLIRPLIKAGMDINIQTGARVIGRATLLDYTYSP
jgi:hypothetical protein